MTGVDEHGQKIQRTAEAKQQSPQDHWMPSVTHTAISGSAGAPSGPLRSTTDPRHLQLVHQFYDRVKASGDVSVAVRPVGTAGCEEFKDDPADAVELECSIHRPLEWRDEENLFSDCRAISRRSKHWSVARTSSNRPVVAKRFVSLGSGCAISRCPGPMCPGTRFDHDGHTFYVWFDALLGYLTALGRRYTPISNGCRSAAGPRPCM